jgi:hypothetical protein
MRTTACAVLLMLAGGCATTAGVEGARESSAHQHGCMKMMSADHGGQAGTKRRPIPKCRMMHKSEPDAAQSVEAPEHDHVVGSGPILVGAQAPQITGQGKELPAPATGEVIVKFKDDGKVKDIIDAFWKDPAAAKARFDVFKHDRPEMAAASLARVTYSNELVLVFPRGARGPAGQATDIRQIAARLASASDIAYAEPDMTVHTQH